MPVTTRQQTPKSLLIRANWISSIPSQWILLITLSAVLGELLVWLGVPAALLLGPMIAGVAVTSNGGRLQIASWPFVIAQGIIGCMIAEMLPTSMSGQVGSHISLFVVGVVSVIAASAFLGWLLTRTGTLPGTTAVWGLSPGAATAMTLMAESFGADVELVALMQYLRVVLVAAVSSLILRVWGGATVHHAIASADWFPAIRWLPFAETTGLVLAGVTLARRLALPAGALFIPLVGEIILVHHGFMTIELPRWLLVIAYAVFGWRIGLRITPPLLAHAAKVLPRVLLSTVALIVLCGAFAAVLVWMGGVDPRTAYLATSPGGADTIAIIAASSNVDVRFVMGMQMLRFVVILVVGPALAKFLANRANVSHNVQKT